MRPDTLTSGRIDTEPEDNGARVYRFPTTDRVPAVLPGPRADTSANDRQDDDNQDEDGAAAGRVVAGVSHLWPGLSCCVF